jgi:nicotinate-nucleotide adenylyltransferase
VERIGLFGGTFDPPHLGHSILAAEARHALKLDRVFWILTPVSPLKNENNIYPLPQRLTLLKAALTEMPEFEFSDVDVSRPAPHFALDTIRIIKGQYPNAEIVYLMGGDSLRDLPFWHDPQKFIDEISEIGVLRRYRADNDLDHLNNLLPGVKAKVTFFDAPIIEISGADIRHRIQHNRPYKYFLLPSVYQCIEDNAFYRIG